jgi:peptide/nickel transport system ATP-binding protein
MIYVTHDPLDVRLLSDQVLVIHQGKLVQKGHYQDLVSRPAHPVVRELLVYD